jgi:predicted nucleic acid-binding protein
MPGGPVVLNNSPLISLWVLDRLDLLRDLFHEVLIPATVEEEFLAREGAARRQALAAAPWIRSVELANPRRALAYVGLDRGEAAVLALAEERDARLVILDDRKARRYAERMRFPLSGTVGVLLLAKETGKIDSLSICLNRLKEAGLFLSPALTRRALQIAGEEAD